MDTGSLLLAGSLIAFLGVALGIALGCYVWPVMRETAAGQAAQLEAAGLRGRVEGLNQQLTEATRQARSLEQQLAEASTKARDSAAEIARLTERERGLTEKIVEQATQLASLQEQLTTEFENIANRILKAKASEMSESSKTVLEAIVAPLRDRISEFQKKVETTYDAETREVLSLKEQIKTVIETTHAIGSQADGLAKALRGNSQIRGRWGEVALERILEAAGLTLGREYIPQGQGLALKSETGGLQKPDIVVLLPEKRSMVIDLKVSLTGYERLVGASDEQQRAAAGEQFIRDVKAHIVGLAGKRYQENEKLQAHDCVLMFVPIEGALAAALLKDPELFTYAWDRNVVIVGPCSLLMTMKTVASIWRYELQGQHAQEIARLAGDLCDKVSLSLGDLNTVAERINGALAAHTEAVKRLAIGRGNAISVGERIRELGVKTKRPMPAMLIDGVSVQPEADIEEPLASSAEAARA